MNGAYRKHGRLLRIDLAADYGLRHQNKLGGQNKVPRVARTPQAAEEVLAISRELGNE